MKISSPKALAAALAVLAVTIGHAAELPSTRAGAAELAKRGRALYEEKCRTVAGQKIYKTVDNVDGLLLMKVRPFGGEAGWQDPNWPGAAFARESTRDEYITTFLAYEYPLDPSHVKPGVKMRGQIGTTHNPTALPGYRYVEVVDEVDGKRYRYVGSDKVVGRKDVNAYNVQMELRKDPNYDLNVYRWTLDKSLSSNPAPRYGVTFEDHVIPEERALWVASSTVKVIDLQIHQVLGEMTRYAWAGGGPTSSSPSPWLRARRCPDEAVGTNAATRKFVDQILMPKKGN